MKQQLTWPEGLFTQGGECSRAGIRAIALPLLALLGIYLTYRLARPCIPSLVWAAALALVFAPLHRRIERRWQRPNLAAAFSLVIVGLLVVVPTTWFAQKLAEQTIAVPERVQKQIAAGKWQMRDDEHPQLARLLKLVEAQISSPQSAEIATTWLKTVLSRFVKESAVASFQVCLTLYFFFYFLRDRFDALNAVRSLLPLRESDADILFRRINDTIHAVLYGMFAFSALQGVLGGLMFTWFGVPCPWFWALVAALFAFVPVLDMVILWLPAAVYLGLEGRWGEALVAATLGSLLVRGIETFLYPVLVKDRLKLPSVSIFVSLAGGLFLFGWSGLVLGPVIVTATSTLLQICAKRFPDPDAETGSVNGSRLQVACSDS